MEWMLDQILDAVGRDALGLMAIGTAKATVLWALYMLFLKFIAFKRWLEAVKVTGKQAREHEKLFGSISFEERNLLWRAQGFRPSAFFLVPIYFIGCLVSLTLMGLWVTLVLWGLVAQWPVSESWPFDLTSRIIWIAGILFIAYAVKESLRTHQMLKKQRDRGNEAGKAPARRWIGWSIQVIFLSIIALLFFLAPSGLIFYWVAGIVVSSSLAFVYRTLVKSSVGASVSTFFGVL